jgi:hypothetical protein
MKQKRVFWLPASVLSLSLATKRELLSWRAHLMFFYSKRGCIVSGAERKPRGVVSSRESTEHAYRSFLFSSSVIILQRKMKCARANETAPACTIKSPPTHTHLRFCVPDWCPRRCVRVRESLCCTCDCWLLGAHYANESCNPARNRVHCCFQSHDHKHTFKGEYESNNSR